MSNLLRQDEIDKIPEDGIDFRDFILQVASNNNWVFDWSEYSIAIANAQKGALGRVSTTLKELEYDRFVIKQSGHRVYNVTTKGREYHKTGKTTKKPNNPLQINANNVVFANGDINAPLSLLSDHSSSSVTTTETTDVTIPQTRTNPKRFWDNKYIISIVSGIIVIIAGYFVMKMFGLTNL